ncbi:hypothetical protein Tco_0643505 [Tanacetum coccineum]
MPIDSPLHDVHSHGSAEGSVQQHDLTVLVTKLNDQIDGLDKDLQQTKKTYSTALTKLVLKVKKLEYKLKFGKARRKAKIVLSDDEEITEASSKQGRKIYQIDEDLMISLVQDEGQERSAKDKGKAIMEEPATPKKGLSLKKILLNQGEKETSKTELIEKKVVGIRRKPLAKKKAGDLKILVDPEQDDDIWKNQSQWKIISWKLYETYGVHTLMVDGTLITIRMFVEKKYPLTKETLQKLLN